MAYPPPPGSSTAPHHALPARPPPSSLPLTNNASRAPPYGGFGGFAPRQVVAPPTYHASPQAAYPQQAYNPYAQHQQQDYAYGAAPQIRNPFAPPTQGSSAYKEEDPEIAAQIAQWQSAYSGNNTSTNGYSTCGYTGPVKKQNTNAEGAGSATSANAAPLGGGKDNSGTQTVSAAGQDTGVAAIVSDVKTNKKTVVRTGGGTKWTDDTLLEWDPAHFRLFIGNLAGEVTDESLYKAFSRWPSIQKARVIRDKRTTKSKGFGFVSFSDGDDFFQAARDMQGKYIGSHPVLLSKSKTEIKAVTPKDHKKAKNRGKGNNNKNHDRTGAGVQKSGNKTKGGLKVLG